MKEVNIKFNNAANWNKTEEKRWNFSAAKKDVKVNDYQQINFFPLQLLSEKVKMKIIITVINSKIICWALG